MIIDVVMPKMGESITEGTVLEWYKKVGESIEKIEENTFLIDDVSSMNLQSDSKVIIRESEGKKELLVPIQFKNKSATVKQTISWQ